MATIKDMIPAFDLVQPTSVEDAVALLREHGDQAWVLAGGLDSFDWFKDRVKRPSVVVDIGGIDEIHGIRDAQGGLEIGAMVTLTDVINHGRVQSEYSLAGGGRGRGRDAPDPQSGDAWRQHLSGHALLVLPERMALLPGRRERVLRVCADRHEP